MRSIDDDDVIRSGSSSMTMISSLGSSFSSRLLSNSYPKAVTRSLPSYLVRLRGVVSSISLVSMKSRLGLLLLWGDDDDDGVLLVVVGGTGPVFMFALVEDGSGATI